MTHDVESLAAYHSCHSNLKTGRDHHLASAAASLAFFASMKNFQRTENIKPWIPLVRIRVWRPLPSSPGSRNRRIFVDRNGLTDLTMALLKSPPNFRSEPNHFVHSYVLHALHLRLAARTTLSNIFLIFELFSWRSNRII